MLSRLVATPKRMFSLWMIPITPITNLGSHTNTMGDSLLIFLRAWLRPDQGTGMSFSILVAETQQCAIPYES
jgi:hypothetical protein